MMPFECVFARLKCWQKFEENIDLISLFSTSVVFLFETTKNDVKKFDKGWHLFFYFLPKNPASELNS